MNRPLCYSEVTLCLIRCAASFSQSKEFFVAFSVNSWTSDWIAAIVKLMDMAQALLQIVVLYNAKDVKLQLTTDDGHVVSPSGVAVLQDIMVVISITKARFPLPELTARVNGPS